MLQFTAITLDDKTRINEFFRRKDFPGDQYSFGNLFIWRNIFHAEICIEDDFLFVKSGPDNHPVFMCPVGAGDLKQAVDKLLEWCHAKGCQLRMEWVPAEDKTALEMFYGDRARISTDRDHYDYIYSRDKLCTLAGKKLHAKRNFVNRFKKTNWSYEPITQANMADCRAMQQEWCKTNNCCTDPDKRDECCAVQQAFQHFDELGFTGGCLRQDGRVVAYTIGEPLNSNTFIVHIEKAFADVPGAYPMINQQFVEHAMDGFEYVNREDDVGDEGLRKAKLSYYPERLLEDYIVEID